MSSETPEEPSQYAIAPLCLSPLSPFYLPIPNSPHLNMITHPQIIASLNRQTTFKEHIYTQAQGTQSQVDKMQTIMKEFKRRSVNVDHDRMGRLMRENQQMRKVNRRLAEQVKVLKEELGECKELLSHKGIFALKVRFHQQCEEVKDRIDAFRQFVVKELVEIKDRIKNVEKQVYVKQMIVKKEYQKIRMSDSIQALDPPQNQPNLESFIFGRRRRIFQDNQELQQQTKSQYYLLNNQNILSFEEVQEIKESVASFGQKIDILVSKISNFQNKKQQLTNMSQNSGIIKVQAVLAESKILYHDSNEFLSLLKRIEVIQSDLSHLDQNAKTIATNLRKQSSPDKLYWKHRSPGKYKSTPNSLTI